jgi:hypothetical protein
MDILFTRFAARYADQGPGREGMRSRDQEEMGIADL